MRILKQSTAVNVMVFMTDSADHIAGKTGLTLTITASKDGAAFASITPTVTERGSGWYNLALTTAHTDTLGDLALHVTSTGADPSDLISRVIAVDLADAVRFGLTALPNANANANGGLPILSSSGTTLGYTVSTLTTYTGNTPQTGDSFARIGAAGASLTALGDTRIANLDAPVSSRLAPGGTLATVTTLTNLPAITTDWLTAAGVKADAVTKIQAGLSTFSGGAVASVTAPVTVTGTVAANVTQWLGTAAATPTVAGVPEVDVTYVNGSAATVTAGPITGTVASATTTSVTFSHGTGPAFNATANAYGGSSAIPTHYLRFTSGTYDGLEVTITGSSVSGGNLTVTFATTTGVGTATAGDTVQID